MNEPLGLTTRAIAKRHGNTDFGNRRKWRTLLEHDRGGGFVQVTLDDWARSADVTRRSALAALNLWRKNGLIEFTSDGQLVLVAVRVREPSPEQLRDMEAVARSEARREAYNALQRSRTAAARAARERANGEHHEPDVEPVAVNIVTVLRDLRDAVAAAREAGYTVDIRVTRVQIVEV